MNYNELLITIITMNDEDDFINLQTELNTNCFITEAEYLELWDILCDIHNRFIV